MCYNVSMKTRKIRPLTSYDIVSTVNLKARELVLDASLESSPVARAQAIHCELIKELKRNAPWLLPMVMK